MHCYSYIKLLSLYSRVSHYDGADQIPRKKQKDKYSPGYKYYQFGVLLLKDTTGARIESIIHNHTRDAEQIGLEIFKQWLNGEGEQPVTWQTLVEVLCDVGLTTLASDIADVKLS